MADKKTAGKSGKATPRKRVTKKTTTAKPKRKGGRPSKFDDPDNLDKLKKLMSFWPSLVDTAGWFDVAPRTIEDVIRKHHDMSFRDFRQLYMSDTRLKLKQKAYNMAMSGNTRMMQFLLENWCEMSQKLDQTVKDATPTLQGNSVRDILKDPKLAGAAMQIAEKLASQETD